MPGGREIKIVERVAGRVDLGNVERLEVVAFVFDLGPVTGGEAKPTHDVLELGNRLHQRMPLAQRRTNPGQGIVNTWSGGHDWGRATRFAFGRNKRCRYGGFDFVEPLADGRLFLFGDFSQDRLQLFELATAGTEILDADLLERGVVTTGGNRSQCGRLERVDLR